MFLLLDIYIDSKNVHKSLFSLKWSNMKKIYFASIHKIGHFRAYKPWAQILLINSILVMIHSLKILCFQVITDKIPLSTFRLKAKRSFSRIKSYFWPISHTFYGLLEQITSSDEPYQLFSNA